MEELKTKGIWEGDKETNVDERPEPAQEEQQKPAVYDMLSEADREALVRHLGIRCKRRSRKEKEKTKEKKSTAEACECSGGGAGACWWGIGFELQEASRRWILQVGDAIVENFGVSIKNNFVEEEESDTDME